ncbi:hypothetical protein AA309_19955 [Microvirga vignae]|uniref:Uncharacterized protein n=1 Tax=Microvirga vignae TaxID=1225564 RepID=A0A0H1R889_9HYPH|nr:hypothetical protein [Microvirga vignae]KLK91378.1 hypothetical protein AA309_19955 [Microvirga vignae]
MSCYFSFAQRDTHHWDVSDGRERVFAIRGEPGRIIVRDERSGDQQYGRHPRAISCFETVNQAMAWCALQLILNPKDSAP